MSIVGIKGDYIQGKSSEKVSIDFNSGIQLSDAGSCDAGDGALWKTGIQKRSYELDRCILRDCTHKRGFKGDINGEIDFKACDLMNMQVHFCGYVWKRYPHGAFNLLPWETILTSH